MKDERGFVSLLTCIMLSLLIIVVTLSLVTIESLQLQKSADAEQSLRAYYTSESGVEDAAAKVLSNSITADNLCDDPAPPMPTSNTTFENDANGQAGWTCQSVKFDGSPTGKLSQPDQAVTIDPGTGASFNSMILEWNTNGDPTGNYDVAGSLPDQNTYVNGSGLGGPYAAPPLELTIVQYPGNFNTGNICPTYNPALGCKVTVQNALMVPKGLGGAGTVDYNQGASPGGFLGNGPYPAYCGAQGRPLSAAWVGYLNGQTNADYNCYAVVQNLTGAAGNYIFRLRSRYMPTDYQIVFKQNADGSGSSVTNVPTGAVTIDVTARAGQSYRRVISQLPINKSASGGLNYVMYSDTNICKNFQVLADVPPSGISCPTFP